LLEKGLKDAMKARSNLGTRGVVVLVVLVASVVGALWFGLHQGTVQVTNDPRPEVLPPNRGTAVIAVLRESGGRSLFGIRITASTRYVEVRFLTEPGCSALIQPGDPWPTSFAQCSSPVKIAGKVAGLGVTPSGDSLIGVEFAVPRACFELLGRGMAWPTTDPNCADR
jgi:hypothetical protein